jgi:exonuclease SbcC
MVWAWMRSCWIFERLADGAELIAIAGANGSGKTTIMDNLTPYNLLPSRAATAGPGGFTFYDHVYLPESIKDLTWAHEGRCYRSQIVIRMSGRRKTEAFLLGLDDDGQGDPCVSTTARYAPSHSPSAAHKFYRTPPHLKT